MAANTSNTTLTTNLGVSPYYDDYDSSKGYYRILFRPGYPVQARELTQSQTIMQKQVDRIGKHLFKEGSIVIPGTFGIYTANSTLGAVQYVKVKDYDSSNAAIDIDNFLNETVTGQTTGIKAEISYVLDGTETSTNTKTIYVDYRNVANSNSSIKTFEADEVLTCNAGTLVVASASPTGYGSAFRISEGVFYAKEHFISFETQQTILDRYNASPTCKVGFLINENRIKYTDDASLLDPALESSNYSAPGADRLQLDPILTVKEFEDSSGPPDFVTLFTIKDGIIVTNFERSQYNILQDEMAKRTYDESGNYYVRGLDIAIREHLDDGTNGGRFTSANGGNSQVLSVQVSPGLAYVQGYEIGTLTTTYLATEKALDYKSVNSQLASASMGSYVTVNEMTGVWTLDEGQEVLLYDTAQQRLTNGSWSTGAQSGSNIGTARLGSIEWVSGLMGTPSAVYNIYLVDVDMIGSNTFSNVKSLYYNNASVADLGADVVLNASNNAVLQDSAYSELLYYVGSNYTKTIKPSGVSDTTFTYKVSTDVADISGGTFSLTLPSGADQFPYGTATLSDTQKKGIFIAISADANVTMSGTVSNSGTTLTGSGTNFDRLNVGDKITITGVSGTYYIDSIASATSMVLTSALASTASGAAYKKQYKNGDIIDLTSLGADAGVERTVSATSTQLDFDLKETLNSTTPATVSYPVSSTSSIQINKTLRSDRFVKINTASNSANTVGPYNLGIPDVFRIKEIRLDTAELTSNTQGSNVLSQFIIDNGQRDNYYEHATITPTAPLATGSHLLVRLDYFEPDFTVGQGFFSVDSYPIDDSTTGPTTIKTAELPIYKSSVTGKSFDLRNYLDFRPIKTRTATDATVVASASENPGASTTFNYDANGMRMPEPFSQIAFDYEYYLARKDVVTLSKDKVFTIVRGVPAAVPITPSVQDGVMAIGTITIAPYPSLSLFYANQINRKDLASSAKKTASIRHTMRDIGVLKSRIINLEYYAALSMLEKDAIEMKILDADGLDRFKNGIFVDTFTSHVLGATYSSDYRIVVDPDEKSIRPIYSMDSIPYTFVGAGTNVKKNGDIVTLDYTEVQFLDNPNATTTRNTERTTYRYVGFMTLDPDSDIWVSTEDLPDNSVTLNLSDAYQTGIIPTGYEQGLTTEWNSWQRYITGYNVYTGSQANPQNIVGSFDTINEANAVANQLRASTSVTIETLFESQRTGVQSWSVENVESKALGARVVNVDIIPYIRPQTIKIKARQLKPYARYYVFFDQVDLSNYVTPLTDAEYNQSVITYTASSEGDVLRADANGVCNLILRIPNEQGKKFYIGTKLIKVTDSPTNSDDETSYAEGHFVAQGLVQTKQDTILSTRQVINKESTISASRSDPSTLLNIPRIVPPPPVVTPPPDTWTGNDNVSASDGDGGDGSGCAAYAFQAKAPVGEEGLFITSMDVYIADKHPELGIWFELLEVSPTGQVTQNQLPFSAVWLNSSDITLSDDGNTNPTTLTFQAPIFLENNKYYALAMHPEAINPNYYFWISKIGQTDVNTGNPVNSRLYTGRYYNTNNGIIWDVVPDVDLTFKAYRAQFNTNTSGVATLGNKPREKIVLANTSASITKYGQYWTSGDRLTLTGITGGSINITDLIIGQNTSVNSAVLANSSTYNMANTGYVAGETINVSFANGTSKGVTATISSIATPATARLIKVLENATETVAYFDNSNGLFLANDRILTAGNEFYADIDDFRNYRYSTVDIEPAYINFARTGIKFEIKTWSNTGTEGTFAVINPNENFYFDTERAIFSRSEEVVDHSGSNTQQLQVTMTSSSNYLSPVLDLGRSHSIIVDNFINSNTYNETNASGGYLYNKYISKIVTLAEDQDAEDMTVVLTAYRPPNTDVKVWVKILNNEDADPITQRPWIELEKKNSGDGLYSSLADRNDFVEYSYGFPSANLTGSLGEVQYRNTANTATFTGYKYFSIKIGLCSDNSAVVPRVADLRTIALQI